MLLFPCFMSFHKQELDSISVMTCLKSFISHATSEVYRCIVVYMCLETVRLTAERPLIRSIFAVRIVAHTTLLRRVGRDYRSCHPPSFFCVPLDLLWNMSKLGCS